MSEASDARLPTFVIIGAAKCGTSSLDAYLREHPQVYMAPGKELRFFDRDGLWHTGAPGYARCFAGAKGELAIGEATPSYMLQAHIVAPRMASLIPHAKLIAILRDPVERAYSHYWHVRSRGGERRSFREAAEASLGDFDQFRMYLPEGRYLDRLMPFLDLFRRQRLHIEVFERFATETYACVSDILRFLAVDDRPHLAGIARAHNASHSFRITSLNTVVERRELRRRAPRAARLIDRLNVVHRPYPPISPDDHAWLADYYAEPNRALRDRLGIDLGQWSGTDCG